VPLPLELAATGSRTWAVAAGVAVAALAPVVQASCLFGTSVRFHREQTSWQQLRR